MAELCIRADELIMAFEDYGTNLQHLLSFWEGNREDLAWVTLDLPGVYGGLRPGIPCPRTGWLSRNSHLSGNGDVAAKSRDRCRAG